MLTSVLPTHFGEVLLTRSLKAAAVLLVAFALDRLARWMVRRLVRGLQQQQVQQRLASIRAKTPRVLRSTEPLPSLRRSQRADAIGALLRNLSSVVIWLVAGVSILQILGLRLGRCWPGLALSAWPLPSAPSSWSPTSWPASPCCWRTSTAWAM